MDDKEIPASHIRALGSPASDAPDTDYCRNCDARVTGVAGTAVTCRRCWNWFVLGGGSDRSTKDVDA